MGEQSSAPRGQLKASGCDNRAPARALTCQIIRWSDGRATTLSGDRLRMKAIVIHNFGPPEVLKYEDVPDPVPRLGEIRVRIHAATVNRVLDVSLRAGKEPRRQPVLPLIPGVDCAGIVDAVGPGVTRWQAGARVAGAGHTPLDPSPQGCDDYRGP